MYPQFTYQNFFYAFTFYNDPSENLNQSLCWVKCVLLSQFGTFYFLFHSNMCTRSWEACAHYQHFLIASHPTFRYLSHFKSSVLNAYLCAYLRATAYELVLGASTHPWAIREWISEASIVILNGSRLLLDDPKRKHFVGENGHFLSVNGPSKPCRSDSLNNSSFIAAS